MLKEARVEKRLVAYTFSIRWKTCARRKRKKTSQGMVKPLMSMKCRESQVFRTLQVIINFLNIILPCSCVMWFKN
jgi:hypothetical protein